jgi:prephenate dehydrogenase
MNNSEILNVHKEFMKSTKEFNRFVEDKDENAFIENIENSEKYF